MPHHVLIGNPGPFPKELVWQPMPGAPSTGTFRAGEAHTRVGLLRRYPGSRWLWIGQMLSQLGNAVFLIMGLWEIQLRSPCLLAGPVW